MLGTAGSITKRRVPYPPGFLSSLLGSANFMRLSLEKGAHAVLSSAAWQESGGMGHPGIGCTFCRGQEMPRSFPGSGLLRQSLRYNRATQLRIIRCDSRPFSLLPSYS